MSSDQGPRGARVSSPVRALMLFGIILRHERPFVVTPIEARDGGTSPLGAETRAAPNNRAHDRASRKVDVIVGIVEDHERREQVQHHARPLRDLRGRVLHPINGSLAI